MSKKASELIPPGLVYIADNIISKQNVLGASKKDGAKWAKDLDLPRQSATVFFAGCGYQYRPGLESMMSLIRKLERSPIGAEKPMGIANLQKRLGVDLAGAYRKLMVKGSDADGQPLRDAVRVLRNLGFDVGYLADDEPCCGGLLHYTGMENEFARNARLAYDRLKSHGVEEIISIVPSCTYTLRNLIPQYIKDHDIRVRHFAEVAAEGIQSRRLKFPREVKVTYHDPCQLARYLGIVDEPRQILRAIKGVELVEAEVTSREWATCCGGGSGFEAVFPELSEILAVNRVNELVETGASIIITHCPGCIMQLKDGLKKLRNSEVEVLDLVQVVAMAMEW